MATSPNLKSHFFSYLMEHNRPHLDGLQQWIFQPGMLFHAWGKWWGDRGPRPAPHAGLDLYSFADAHGMLHTVDRHINIPAAFAGTIVKIDQDFLGQSIYISHEIWSDRGRQLYSAYGHTAPRHSLQTGEKVAEGEIIGHISGGSGKKTAIAPHVHITFAWMPVPVDPDRLNWENLGNDPGITLIDPLAVLSPPGS
ncbi:MAG: M23 family metallopeptidase [Desulfobaccales bacterium]